ncbi:MAG: redoxin domain-containing protein [Victivallales bacterium]|nr:redoxin domain-containing protein [Victivallales bacterium]
MMRKIAWMGMMLLCAGMLSARAADWAQGKFGTSLVDAKGKTVETAKALKGVELIGIYFSAHWCPPCRQFTPMLVKFYNECKKDKKSFQIVFVSFDNTEKDMSKYMTEANMPWLAVPYGSDFREKLAKEYNVSGIPMLIVIDKNGKVVSTGARGEVTSKGAKAYDGWKSKAAK